MMYPRSGTAHRCVPTPAAVSRGLGDTVRIRVPLLLAATTLSPLASHHGPSGRSVEPQHRKEGRQAPPGADTMISSKIFCDAEVM